MVSWSCVVAVATSLLVVQSVAAQTTTNNNTPPPNTTATEPWWPQYPDGRSMNDYMLNESATDNDLSGNSDVAQWIIAASNAWRAQFGSQPVTWNETAARIAQNHTNTCLWEHWGNDNLYEMISLAGSTDVPSASQSGSDASMRFGVRSMIEMWADEWTYYPFAHPEEQAYSHFTAMTWNASNTVGCGWNINCSNNTAFPSLTYFVCNYWPGGNIVSSPPGIYFAANIHNFTGWPVNAAESSSIASLTAEAAPTFQTGQGVTRTYTATASPTATQRSAGGALVTPGAALLVLLAVQVAMV